MFESGRTLRPSNQVLDVDDHVAVFDRHGEGLRADAVAEERPPAFEVELPLVPWAAQDEAQPRVLVLEADCRNRRAGDDAAAELSALVRAAVVQREEAAVDVEHADASPVEVDDQPFARGELIGAADAIAPPPAQAVTPAGSASVRAGRP